MRNLLLLLLLGGLLSGCATVGQPAKAADDQAVLAQRADARWKALIQRDMDAAYGFLSPGSKAAYTLELYKKMVQPKGLISAKFHSVRCTEPGNCQVLMEVESMFRPEFGKVTSIKDEQWIKDGDTWWVVFKM
jgi:hypothetical protein